MPPKQSAPVEFHRLTLDQYKSLEKAVNVGTHVDSETSPLRAGFQLGVAHVLAKLRDGFVVGA